MTSCWLTVSLEEVTQMSHPLQELERNHMAEASPQNKQENALKLGAGSDSDSRGTSLASSEVMSWTCDTSHSDNAHSVAD